MPNSEKYANLQGKTGSVLEQVKSPYKPCLLFAGEAVYFSKATVQQASQFTVPKHHLDSLVSAGARAPTLALLHQ